MVKRTSLTEIWSLEKVRQDYTGKILNDGIFDIIVITTMACKNKVEEVMNKTQNLENAGNSSVGLSDLLGGKSPSRIARQKAAQMWSDSKTENIVMIPELAEAFAKLIQRYMYGISYLDDILHIGKQPDKYSEKIVAELLSV